MTKQIDARDWILEISDGASTPTWYAIEELTGFTPNFGENEEVANTTTFDSNGMHESQAMQRGAVMELAGRYAMQDDGTTRAPGQAEVETAAGKVSEASLAHGFRFRHESQSEWTVWTAWFTLGEQGGETNAKTAWNATVHRSGAATTSAVA